MEETRPIELVAERPVYRNQFISVFDDEVRFRSGESGRHVRIVESNGSAGVLALPLCDDRVGLVRTYRYPPASFEWSLPRGFAHGDDGRLSVLAELGEELGAPPVDVEKLGTITPNSGLLAAVVEVFVARYTSTSSVIVDTNEVLDIKWMRRGDLMQAIRRGEIVDGFTLSAVCLAIAAGIFTP